MPQPNQHHWTESDDLAALYVALYKTDHLPYTLEQIASQRGIKPGSFRMRIQNFHALAGHGGLEHTAMLSREIYNRYHHLSELDLRLKAFPEL